MPKMNKLEHLAREAISARQDIPKWRDKASQTKAELQKQIVEQLRNSGKPDAKANRELREQAVEAELAANAAVTRLESARQEMHDLVLAEADARRAEYAKEAKKIDDVSHDLAVQIGQRVGEIAAFMCVHSQILPDAAIEKLLGITLQFPFRLSQVRDGRMEMTQRWKPVLDAAEKFFKNASKQGLPENIAFQRQKALDKRGHGPLLDDVSPMAKDHAGERERAAWAQVDAAIAAVEPPDPKKAA